MKGALYMDALGLMGYGVRGGEDEEDYDDQHQH